MSEALPSFSYLNGQYRGRFAPSPSGPLHAGSLVAALASRLDALAHRGEWLLRIEDLDSPRNAPGAVESILGNLQAFGFRWDDPVVYQSRRQSAKDSPYARAFDHLVAQGLVYPCACSRKEIADSISHRPADGMTIPAPAVYPGTCRDGLPNGRTARAWRMRCGHRIISFEDRWQGRISQDLQLEVGDFVLRRADGAWAYQLAVVVDDAEQGITDVVRGADLIDSTPRQILLQDALGLTTPRYLHVPVLVNSQGEKLSKQTGADALDPARALLQLHDAARHLGLKAVRAETVGDFWEQATRNWAGLMMKIS